MGRFILIDHSITELGGHHYQYALHVLRAAEAAGYTPLLVTNRRFKAGEKLPWEVIPVYRYGFWYRLQEGRFYRLVRVAFRRIRGWSNATKYRFVFSKLGFLWLIRGNPAGFLRQHPYDPPFNPFFLLLASSVFLSARLIGRLIIAVIPFRSYWSQLLAAVGSILIVPVRWISSSRTWLNEFWSDRARMRQFSADTFRLFRRIGFREGDLVFLPTIGYAEMIGVADVFAKSKESRQAAWNLLFRRDLYSTRDVDYASQDEALRPSRNAFLKFCDAMKSHRVQFYTDTDELTWQYNRLGIVPFRTLPITHTHPPAARESGRSTAIRVVYAGDARAEKGYHYLPRIVQDLWRDYVAKGRITFVFQSNYNTPDGEPEAIAARCQLESYPADKVKLIKVPLTSSDYADLVASGDVTLLPYERDKYWARSSGILVESLAAGVPVIAPAGTWLARQFADEIYSHQTGLKQTMYTVKCRRASELRWRKSNGEPCLDVLDGETIALGSVLREVYCWLAVPPLCRWLLVTFGFSRGLEAAVIVNAVSLDSRNLEIHQQETWVERGVEGALGTALVTLKPGTRKVWLGFGRALTDGPVSLLNIHVNFLAAIKGGDNPPLGAVGLMYNRIDEVSDLLRDMIDNYAHYRRTASAFAPRILQKHNARRLVSMLAVPEDFSSTAEAGWDEVIPASSAHPKQGSLVAKSVR